MLTTSFSHFIIYVSLYSIFGWICEVIYCSVPAKRFINRGFLNGPYCPMYGIGAVLILTVTYSFVEYPLLVFLLSLCVATLLEYFTGWLMESLFQVRFWDYSKRRLNLKGRICLKNSLLFGIMGLGVTYLLHPFALDIMRYIPEDKLRVLSSFILILFFIDLSYTLNALLNFTERLKALKNILVEMDRYNKEYAWLDKNDLTGSLSRLNAICREDADNQDLANVLFRLENILGQREWNFRFIKSFPQMKPKDFDTVIENLRNVWEQQKEQLEERRESLRQRAWNATKRFGRQTAAATKETAAFFASGKSFYKLFWVFVSASILGYAIESVFYFLTTGTIESRQGMLYGPFCQVYGFGAVLMVLTLMPLAKKGNLWLFCGSALFGGVFGSICSWVQEQVFGFTSWGYAEQAFSIGARSNLIYMVFWGILGLCFIKGIYPKLSRLIERIPKRQGLFFSWILIITLSVNLFLSATAVYRWSERQDSIPPSNAYEDFLDKQYPDEILEEIYPGMV